MLLELLAFTEELPELLDLVPGNRKRESRKRCLLCRFAWNEGELQKYTVEERVDGEVQLGLERLSGYRPGIFHGVACLYKDIALLGFA